MTDLTVIYDPDLELAAIVDVDGRCGWGPAMVGPQAKEVLEAFIAATPFDVSLLAPYEAQRAFESFIETAGGSAGPPPPAVESAVEPPGGVGGGDDAALAVAEAHAAAGEPPGPAPADPDADAGVASDALPIVELTDLERFEDRPQVAPAPQAQVCPMCEGRKVMTVGDPPNTVPCSMCGGKGSLVIGQAA